MKKVVLISLELIFVFLIIFSVYNIMLWLNDNKSTKKQLQEVKEQVILDDIKMNSAEGHKINFSDLENLNKDSIAWLTVPNTNIDYPIVQSINNDYYLNHNFYKYPSDAGWPYLDYRNKLDDENLIIYAHNRLDGSMFGSLKNLKKIDNANIILTTKDNTYTYQVFSVYEVQEENYYLQTSFSKEKFNEFLNTIKERSIRDYNIDLTSTNQVLTLSTCTINDNDRLVVHAKR